jgi:hypothetical protein
LVYLRRVCSRQRNRYAGVLVGYDRPDHRVTTSPVIAIEGDLVTTRSGSVYRVTGPDRWARKSLTDFEYPFFLDTDGAETWPPGSEVPPLEEDDDV